MRCNKNKSKNSDCFIRVTPNNCAHISSSYVYICNHFTCFDILSGSMAVYLANEISTIVNYIHTATGDTFDFDNVIHY